jgi:hypothetical protein
LSNISCAVSSDPVDARVLTLLLNGFNCIVVALIDKRY